MLDFHVKTGTRFSLQDKQLFKISEVEIMRVDCNCFCIIILISYFQVHVISDLIIPRLVTNGTAKICCLGLILALFYSTMVIKKDFG